MTKELRWTASVSGKELREMLASPDYWLDDALTNLATARHAMKRVSELTMDRLDAATAPLREGETR